MSTACEKSLTRLNHFIDADGNPVDTDIEDRIVSTSLETLQGMRNVVGVAGGKVKIPAINAVLKHGYLNVLVTDEVTARGLLSYGEAPTNTAIEYESSN